MRAKRFFLVLLVTGLLAVACSASSSTYGNNYAADQQNRATYNPGAPGVYASMAPGSQSGGAKATSAALAPGATSNAAAPENQIVKTGTIKIQVAALDDSIARATDQIHALGGWLAGSDRSTDIYAAQGSVTYRIPVNQFESALAAMRKFGTSVLYEHTDSTPVGGEIVDLQARITNLRTTEKAIQAIMAKATSINDVLTVQQRLTDVQSQIEQYSGQLAGLTDQAAYSTLTVGFVVPYAPPSASPTPTASPSPTEVPWNAGEQAGQAAGTLGQVGQSAATLLIWIVVLILPVTLAFVLVLALFGFAWPRLDPYRKRLLPFTVAKPVTYSQSPVSYSTPYRPTPGTGPVSPVGPVGSTGPISPNIPTGQTGPKPEDKPKA